MVEIGQMLILFLEQCFVYILLLVGIESIQEPFFYL